MPALPATSLRVAECGDCHQLFAVYETAGAVSCPGCGAAVELASLEVAEIGVAAPVEIEVEAPAVAPPVETFAPQAAVEPPAPEPVLEPEPTPEPVAETFKPVPVAEPEPEPAAEERPPTVAEWLLRGGDPNITASAEPTPHQDVAEPEAATAERQIEEPAAKPSLSESLGWAPGSFALDNKTEATETESSDRDSAAEPTAVADEFRFDFGATPLAEQTPEPVGLDLASAPEPEQAEDAAQPLVLDWSSPESPRKRSWSGPLSAVAGILLVAAPAAWMVMTWPDDADLSASANRQQRDPMAADAEMPPNPFPPAADSTAETVAAFEAEAEEPGEPNTLPFGAEAASPIRDTATLPASFNAPEAAEPPAFEPEPQPKSPAEPASDPFGPPTAAAESDRYVSAAPAPTGDRYASAAPLDDLPDTFSLPEDTPAAPTPRPPVPEAPAADPGQPALINVPYYELAELQKANAGGVPAGRSFAVGTLSNPAQASEMGKNYARLCYLAQVLTLLDPAASGQQVMTSELEATDIFNRLFREAGPRIEAQQIAGPWMAWTGRPHGGVFFSGIPVDIRGAGSATEYIFELGDQRVAVVSPERLDVKRFVNAGAREIGVIGILVDNPRERIAGYQGDSDRVVWVRKTLALRDPVEL